MARLFPLLLLAAALAAPAQLSRAQAAEPEVQSTIIGYRWKILRHFDGSSLVAPDRRLEGHAQDLQPLYITLRQDGWLEGSAGCGALLGPYVLEGTELTLQPGVLIGGSCTSGHFRQQEQIMLALERVRSLRRDGDRVDLLDGEGAVMVELERWPAAT